MKYVAAFFSPLIFLISFFFPKDSNVWLYGAWFGFEYKDNSKAFFEYSNGLSLETSIKHIWVYKNKSVRNKIPNNLVSVYAYSIKGILLQLKAKVFICTLNTSDFIPFFVTPKSFVVQLWHGSPLKNIGIDSRKTSVRRLLDRIRYNTLDRYTLCVSPASIFDSCFKSAFLLKQDQILRTGYPRNSSLFISEQRKIEIRKVLQVDDDDFLVMYLPTHRNEGNNSPLVDQVKKLFRHNNIFLDNNIKLFIKPHFYEWHNFRHLKDLDNIKIMYDFDFDLYELLAASDVLLTDYSSVFFDYELLGKPIIIYPFDIKEYLINDRRMYFTHDYIFDKLINTEVTYKEDEMIRSILRLSKEKSSDTNTSVSVFNESNKGFSETIFNAIQSRLK